MDINDYEYQYCPQLSKKEYDKLDKLDPLGKLEVEIGIYLSQNTYLDEEDAINLVGNAIAQLHFHYYPPLSEEEQIARAVEFNKQWELKRQQ